MLARKDRSSKGSIDARIRPLLGRINALAPYVTTSSCSGRIVLLTAPRSGLKKDVGFLFVSHTMVMLSKLQRVLRDLPEETVWFRFEPIILHGAFDFN
ncbi:MAG: hypothetical protein HY459_00005 [Parcubacteria group bacterium]|nr:hypothetical protein [Parcubacteria group bacterium]